MDPHAYRDYDVRIAIQGCKKPVLATEVICEEAQAVPVSTKVTGEEEASREQPVDKVSAWTNIELSIFRTVAKATGMAMTTGPILARPRSLVTHARPENSSLIRREMTTTERAARKPRSERHIDRCYCCR